MSEKFSNKIFSQFTIRNKVRLQGNSINFGSTVEASKFDVINNEKKVVICNRNYLTLTCFLQN